MPPSSSSSNTDGYDLVLRLLLGVLAVVVPLSHLAWLSGNITAYLTGTNWAPYQPTKALLHPEQVWPAAGETSLLIGARIIPFLLFLALGAGAGVLWARHKNRSGGRKKKITDMAKARDIEPLMAKAITDKARSLRPSLKDSKHIDAKDTGILLGNLQRTRHEVRMGFEDVAVAIMAPRSGKTTSLAIPSMLGAPGPVLLTSNKAAGDAFTTAYEARARAGAVWTMDPQQIAHAAREMWWNPLASAKNLDGANRLAGHFLAASVDASQQGDFWSKAAATSCPNFCWPQRSTSGPSPTSCSGSPSLPTALRWTSCVTTVSPRSPLSSRGLWRGRRRPGTASTRPPGSTPPRS